MKTKLLFTLLLTLSGLVGTGQIKMRRLDELLDKNDSGWPLIQQWIKEAKNQVNVFPCDTLRAKDALYKSQVSTHSIMGAIIYHTGGIFIDNGWIRILGSGSEKLNRPLMDWNKGKTFQEIGDVPSFLLIADDAAGGFYALNGGRLGEDLGKVYYLPPDNLEWDALHLSYTDFLLFCLNGDLNKFFKGLRWKNWISDVSNLDGNMTYSFYPYLWTIEGKDVNKNNKSVVPIEEVYQLKRQ